MPLSATTITHLQDGAPLIAVRARHAITSAGPPVRAPGPGAYRAETLAICASDKNRQARMRTRDDSPSGV